jgi:uncharacterized protein involved in exopolysaccharide biosynthesis
MNGDGALVAQRESPQGGGLPGMGALLQRIPWVVLAAVLGLAGGLGLDLVRTPVYESTAYLAVTSEANQDARSMARSAQALARLATSPGIVGDPLRDAGLADAAADPRRFIRVQAAPDASIISITGTSTNAATARRTAETVSEALTGLDAVDPFDVAAVGSPLTPDEPTIPSWVAPAGGAGIATALAVVLAGTLPDQGGRRGLRGRGRQA